MKDFKPAGWNQVSPYLIIDDVDRELKFLTTVFKGDQLDRVTDKEGTVVHGEVRIGTDIIMMGAAKPEFPSQVCMIHIYVPNCDETYRLALSNGASSMREPQDEYYGDRSAGVVGPNGIQYWIATHQRVVSEEEIQRHHDQK